MEHVVFFPAPDGAPVFRRVPTIEDAVRLVEHLRNVEGIGEVAVHPLGAEVPLAFRAYYRVEVPGAVGAPEVPAAPVLEAPVQVAEQAPVLAVVAPAEVVAEASAEPTVEPVAEAVVPEQAEPQVEASPELVDAAPNGHARDGVSSLGFFA